MPKKSNEARQADGTTITLNQHEVKLLRKKLTANAEWHFADADVAGDVLHKLRIAEEGRVVHGDAVTLCPNCETDRHARCCSWCGKIHRPARLHYEHCSATCDRAAAQADQFSAAMEETT